MASTAQSPVPISITICGDGGCGKSSITLRLVRSAWTSDYDPTIEDNYSVTRVIDGVTARLEVNIEETFALIVKRVVERRRLAEEGVLDNTEMSSRGMTKPLTPLPAGADDGDEKRGPGVRGPMINGDKVGRGQGGFWKKLRCW
ncbi:hypothetical protein M440DRAFT_1390765 [Trichoderma longibrachiatum ATCC 18648]|uniref:Ras-domain-containing protein n=1 Tax=Trichoderma longibrachiatum ATCC 18648 TaxID=983965 RepID=A0A2T4C7A5_TRILO|nr:hypothetical protein M440DRAFT_1390765 [Trichoderma longibrachiatum ATCC 18648]